jgi:hypothetical protein
LISTISLSPCSVFIDITVSLKYIGMKK